VPIDDVRGNPNSFDGVFDVAAYRLESAQPLELCALVREQGQHCVCPVGDVVELLLVTDPHESGGQDVEFLLAEPLPDFFVRRCVRPTGVHFGLTGQGEADDPLAAAPGHGELIEEFVNTLAPLGRQRGDRLGQVGAVVVGCVHRHPLCDERRHAYLDGPERRVERRAKIEGEKELLARNHAEDEGEGGLMPA
jgi:hypothetical protein